MSGREVAIVRTGVANIASVASALRRFGHSPVLVREGREIERAELLILPGVGAFGAGMDALRELGLVESLRERVQTDRPTLAICLGLQLLCESSEESPGAEGLGVIPMRVSRLGGSGLRLPQFGWNRAEADPECTVLGDGFAYYANSYALRAAPEGWRAAWSDYGGRFVAGLERGAVVVAQFHPELSGPFGHELLSRWLARSLEGAPC